MTERIKLKNKINGNLIRTGQNLRIPYQKSLSEIAEANNYNIKTLIQDNQHIRSPSYILKSGSKIIVRK